MSGDYMGRYGWRLKGSNKMRFWLLSAGWPSPKARDCHANLPACGGLAVTIFLLEVGSK